MLRSPGAPSGPATGFGVAEEGSQRSVAAHQVNGFSAPDEGGLVAVDVDGAPVAVAVVEGQVHAFDATCPHAGCSLVDGNLDGATVTCPCHFARFDVTTGAVLGGPTRKGVRTWPARLADGTLELDAPQDARPAEQAASAANAGGDSAVDRDVTVLIEREHDALRRQFAALERGAGADELRQAWAELVQLLEIHASGEESLLYPHLVRAAQDGAEDTEEAVRDHNAIRESVRAVERYAVGNDLWWAAVELARRVNSEHLEEEERDLLPTFRRTVDRRLREDLGERWAAFAAEHAGARGLSRDDTDPQAVIRQPPP